MLGIHDRVPLFGSYHIAINNHNNNIIQTEKIHLEYSMKGVVSMELQPKLICKKEELCHLSKVERMCENPETTSCSVELSCRDKDNGFDCHCGIDLECHHNEDEDNNVVGDKRQDLIIKDKEEVVSPSPLFLTSHFPNIHLNKHL